MPFLPDDHPPALLVGDLLGGLCVACGRPIPAALAGMTEHPCCDPDFPPMQAACQRAEARAKV